MLFKVYLRLSVGVSSRPKPSKSVRPYWGYSSHLEYLDVGILRHFGWCCRLQFLENNFACISHYFIHVLCEIGRLHINTRLIFEFTPRDHTTPSLLQLHWLPVYARASSISCDAICWHRKMAGLSEEHCTSRSRQTDTLWLTVFVNISLSTSAAQDQAQWACVLTRWSVRVECTVYTHARDVPNFDTFRELLKTPLTELLTFTDI